MHKQLDICARVVLLLTRIIKSGKKATLARFNKERNRKYKPILTARGAYMRANVG
jgi:hypothetical protein